MIHLLRRGLRDASCEGCSRPSDALHASSFVAAVSTLHALGWHVTVAGRTYCADCAALANTSPASAIEHAPDGEPDRGVEAKHERDSLTTTGLHSFAFGEQNT